MGIDKSISSKKNKNKRALPDSNWDNSNRQLDTLPN
jgi:hypothetical protein